MFQSCTELQELSDLVRRIVLPFNITDSADKFIEMFCWREARVGTLVVMQVGRGRGVEQLFNLTQTKYSYTSIDNKNKY